MTPDWDPAPAPAATSPKVPADFVGTRPGYVQTPVGFERPEPSTRSKRDGYANRVYAAEDMIPGSRVLYGDDVWREVKRVMGRKRVRALLPSNGALIHFKHSPGQGGGWYHGGGRIILAHSKASGLRDFVIVHELAHAGAAQVYVQAKHARRASGSHGPRFTSALLRLYRAAYGKERAMLLNNDLARRGVKCVGSTGRVVRLSVDRWNAG